MVSQRKLGGCAGGGVRRVCPVVFRYNAGHFGGALYTGLDDLLGGFKDKGSSQLREVSITHVCMVKWG